MKRVLVRWTLGFVGILALGVASRVAEAGTVVRFELNYAVTTTAGSLSYFDVELEDSAAPITAANFIKYVNAGLYNDTIFHRKVNNFVVQGGGFTPTTTNGQITGLAPITNYGTIQNEFSSSRSNLVGTVAMAKLEGNPNSASNQWFVNLGDNSANLDNQNGGFTVFGHVLDNGMALVNAINGLTNYDISGSFGSTFTEVPLINNATDFVRIKNAAVRKLSAFSGRAYVDANHDGVADGGDYAIADAKVSLMQAGSSTPVATVYTGKDGVYHFDSLAAGTYTLKMESSSGTSLDNGDARLVVERDGTIVSTGTAGTVAANAYTDTTLGGSQRGLDFDFAQSAYPVDLMSARMLLNTNSGISTVTTAAALSALSYDATSDQSVGSTAGGETYGGGNVVSAGGASAVPEPGTMALLVLGGLSLAGLARRRRK